MKTIYELRHFKTSSDSSLTEALKLYSKNIEAAYRTDTREILYWIDRFNKESKDSFYIFGFYLNNALIGFAEAAHFWSERMVILDYLIIETEYLGNNTFYEFLEKIRMYLANADVQFDYITVEVGYLNEFTELPAPSRQWVRLLKMVNFGVVKCNYYIPRLGDTNFESEMKGILMINTGTEEKLIRKETYLKFVNAIYFKYYLRWYSAFMSSEKIIMYNKTLNIQVVQMEKELENVNVIEINGFPNVFPYQSQSDSKQKDNKLLRLITTILSFTICSILVGVMYLYLKSKYDIDANSLAIILAIAAFLVLFSGVILFENKSNIFSRLLMKIIDKF